MYKAVIADRLINVHLLHVLTPSTYQNLMFMNFEVICFASAYFTNLNLFSQFNINSYFLYPI